jgi:hypothetical protein
MKKIMVKNYGDYQLVIFDERGNIDGFTVQPGFAGLLRNDQLMAVTSGYNCNGSYYVYRRRDDGWIADWEDEENSFPASDVEEALQEYNEQQDFEAACKQADATEEPLYDGDDFSTTDVVAGEKCNNGGEYGFWTTYSRTMHPGVYRVVSHTTCDFDACGTGYEGYQVITRLDFERMMAESERVEARGSLYN